MYKISHSIYSQLSERLIENISSLNYFSGVIELECNDVTIRFIATLIPFFREELFFGNKIVVLSDLTPVWWELHTTTSDGEQMNDFDFKIFKEYICQ